MTGPKKVALIGLGGSRHAFGNHTMKHNYQGTEKRWDEVWVINAGFQFYYHDKVFSMDDMRIQAKRYPLVGELLKKHDKPIITSTAYPEFKMAEEYPISYVVKKLGTDYFTNTASYAIAYAMVTGVEDLFIYGCDFAYPDSEVKEVGLESAAYLLGMTRHTGMRYYLPHSSTLLSAHRIKVIDKHTYRPLYGYMTHPLIENKVDAWEIQEDQECRQEDVKNTNSTANSGSMDKQLIVSANGEERRGDQVRQ